MLRNAPERDLEKLWVKLAVGDVLFFGPTDVITILECLPDGSKHLAVSWTPRNVPSHRGPFHYENAGSSILDKDGKLVSYFSHIKDGEYKLTRRDDLGDGWEKTMRQYQERRALGEVVVEPDFSDEISVSKFVDAIEDPGLKNEQRAQLFVQWLLKDLEVPDGLASNSTVVRRMFNLVRCFDLEKYNVLRRYQEEVVKEGLRDYAKRLKVFMQI